MRDALLVLSVFLACAVESVEALTIVLAVGTTRQWRSTWYGVGAALLVLACFVALLGPALTAIPLDALRLVVGALLLIFGLQWLRKAILRASGFTARHDEEALFAAWSASARLATASRRGVVSDWYSFTVAFKGVLLEGLEVAFIVVTFGANQHNVPLAVVGAAIAVLLVSGVGVAVHRPLSRVPENTLKFVVGIMLTGFGTFWGAEGAGVRWPGSDASLGGVIVLVALCAVGLVALLRREHARQAQPLSEAA